MEITFKILWTDFAINQLKDIFDYHLIKASSSIAQKLIQRIIDATIILENNPKSGRKEDLLNTRTQEFRFIIVKNYKFIYWIDYEFSIINISMVTDTRQNPTKITKIDWPDWTLTVIYFLSNTHDAKQLNKFNKTAKANR